MTGTVCIDGQALDAATDHFSLASRRVSDAVELGNLRLLPRLRSASFAGSNLDDEGLAHVCRAGTLEILNLQETLISNGGLAHLERLPALRYLRLKENPQLTNDCVGHLARLRGLVDLQIQETSIDEQGLRALTGLAALRDLCLEVWNGNFTLDGLRTISERMPACRILAKGRGELLAGSFEGEWDR